MFYHFIPLHSLLLVCMLHLALANTAYMPRTVQKHYTRNKADKAANRSLGQAENAYKSAKKAAKEAEKAYRSAAKAAKAARKAHKATIIASWDTVKPNSLLSRLNKSMRNGKKQVSPDEVIEFIKRIYRKKVNGMKLSFVEKETWKSASAEIVTQLRTPNCYIFYSTESKEWAACCRVQANTQFYGFCFLLSALRLSKSKREALIQRETSSQVVRQAEIQPEFRKTSGIVEGDMKSVFGTAGRWYDVFNYGYSEASDESVYIDLLSVPCYPPLDLGLCSQFCCEPNNADSAFCNSELECY